MSTPYDDIINLPHHTSTRHPRMPRSERAAQFSAFDALTGFEELISDTSHHINSSTHDTPDPSPRHATPDSSLRHATPDSSLRHATPDSSLRSE